MKRQALLWTLVVSLFLGMPQGSARAGTQVEQYTVLPKGVTAIDLRTALSDDAQGVEDAWMLNANVCAILRNLPYNETGYHNYEIIVLDMQNLSILSRTRVPRITLTWYQQGWDGNRFYVRFTSDEEPDTYLDEMTDWRQYNQYSYIKVSISPDGEVDVSNFMQRWYTVMPGGKRTVYTSYDKSLWAINSANGEEELLLQGIPRVRATPAGDLYLDSLDETPAYIPFWDELPDAWEDIDDGSVPFLPDDLSFSVREFAVVQPLDEYRFVYTVGGWEWDQGFGIYDLQTHTDHRITGRGNFFGVRGDTLFGTTLKADANTYDTSLLPESVQEQFSEFADLQMLGYDYCDISPDGRLLAFAGTDYDKLNAVTVTLTDIQTGDILKTYSINNPYAAEKTVTFRDDTHFMLFCEPKEHGSAYIYLFNIEE